MYKPKLKYFSSDCNHFTCKLWLWKTAIEYYTQRLIMPLQWYLKFFASFFLRHVNSMFRQQRPVLSKTLLYFHHSIYSLFEKEFMSASIVKNFGMPSQWWTFFKAVSLKSMQLNHLIYHKVIFCPSYNKKRRKSKYQLESKHDEQKVQFRTDKPFFN